MRLTCPNCSAQYEVPDEVIPEEGRDVQCSNCDHTWFQAKHPEAETPEPAEAQEPEPTVSDTSENEPAEPETTEVPEPEETSAVKSTGSIDPAVANILQEEAARESELRQQEGATPLESQPDLALDTSPEQQVEPKRPSAVEPAKEDVPSDSLPDVDAINYGMISAGDEEAEEPVRKSGGFVRGFALMLIVGVVLYLIYGNAQQISQAVPQADPILNSYVSLIDQARIWLEAQAGGS